MKRLGFSDRQLAVLRGETEADVRARRWALGRAAGVQDGRHLRRRVPVVDAVPLLQLRRGERGAAHAAASSVVILGSGPNRIGQGVEFDYCCVRAALALREQGYETIMINSNPETVSTDFDISDKLYFEPLTLEDVLEIVEREQPVGVIVQLGGQTPLKLTRALEAAGVTHPRHVARRDRRGRGSSAVRRDRARARPARSRRTARRRASTRPSRSRTAWATRSLVRPSYVLGGRAMEIVYDEPVAARLLRARRAVSEDRPVLIDRFLEDAYEADVDAVSDGQRVVIGAVMQHIEDAGIHSGDSACVLPPYVHPRGGSRRRCGSRPKRWR